MNVDGDKVDRHERVPEQVEMQPSGDRLAEAGDRRAVKGRSVVFARLLIGLVVLVCAEVFSGASLQNGLWHPWTLIVTYWLYFAHFFFFTTLAVRTGRTSLWSLYLWGVLFGLYESWITKVIWFGYSGDGKFVIGNIGPYGISEMSMVLLFHPMMSFILPLAVTCLLCPSLRRLFPDLAWFTGDTVGARVLQGYLILSFAPVMAMNSGGPVNLAVNVMVATAAISLLSYWARPALESSDGRAIVVFGRWGFIGLCAYLLWLYGVTYFLLRPEGLPSASVQLLTLVFYAVAVAGLWLHRRRQPLDDNAAQVQTRELTRVRMFFAVLVALALGLSALSKHPLLLVTIVPNFFVWAGLGVLLTTVALVVGAREKGVAMTSTVIAVLVCSTAGFSSAHAGESIAPEQTGECTVATASRVAFDERVAQAASAETRGFRGVFFNPNIRHELFAGYPWPIFDPYGEEYRAKIRATLKELADEADINLIDVFLPIPFTLAHPPQANRAGQPIEAWANTRYLDNVLAFIDDCHDAGISIAFDLADNRWIPYSIDSEHHIGCPGSTSWPVADDTPWDESATWYTAIITYIESRTRHPENIAMWGMMGHYQLGTAEPDLWGYPPNPAILDYTERFVKQVWPAFRAAGKRPKASPVMLPVFSNEGPYWSTATPETRLASFTHLKKWLVDDLRLPPDYWAMTTYPFCDPAPDGVHYLRRIVDILGKETASRIISTDLKGPGHDHERRVSIVPAEGRSGREMLEWHFTKCKEYGFAGWWIYCYQDHEERSDSQSDDVRSSDDPGNGTREPQMGIRHADGAWKTDLIDVIKQQ
ncbi:MAG: hypothetical protein MUF25_19005 [Pirellulaceae bacterium]|nr:hypothetical protein [Pirellulaceae bacterium]